MRGLLIGFLKGLVRMGRPEQEGVAQAQNLWKPMGHKEGTFPSLPKHQKINFYSHSSHDPPSRDLATKSSHEEAAPTLSKKKKHAIWLQKTGHTKYSQERNGDRRAQ